MKALFTLTLLVALVASGCAHKKPASAPKSTAPHAGKAAAPGKAVLGGVVSRVEPVGRFVVLTFPLGQMPAIDQHLGVYHQGNRVAEVRISGPQRETNIVADIVSGEPKAGDEARAE